MDTVISKEFGLGNASSTVSFQCIDAIEISLFIEKAGLNFYEKAAKSVLEDSVKKVFLRLAEEEREHIQILQEKLRHLKPAISGKVKSNGKLSSFIKENLLGKIFQTVENDLNKEFENDLEALEYGIESEKRSIDILNSLLIKGAIVNATDPRASNNSLTKLFKNDNFHF